MSARSGLTCLASPTEGEENMLHVLPPALFRSALGLADHVEELARLGQAASGAGVFALGCTPELLAARQQLLALAGNCFAVSDARKRACQAQAGSPHGYHPLPSTGDLREKFLAVVPSDPHHHLPALPGQNRWPNTAFELALVEAIQPFVRAGLAVLEALARDLGYPLEAIHDAFGHGDVAVWMYRYPAVQLPNGSRGQGTSAHRDFHPLSWIVQDDVGGLEVWEANRWHNVDPLTYPVVGQLGDWSSLWSDRRYQACVHRVVSPIEQDRLSVVLFYQPRADFRVRPQLEPFGKLLHQWIDALGRNEAGYVAVDEGPRGSNPA